MIEITYNDFAKVDLRVGTVRHAEVNAKARVPAYVLTVDLGPLGTKTSSAQLTERYAPEEIVGLQVIAVVNFPPKRIAGVKSEVLILGVMDETAGTTLLIPTHSVADGTRIA